MFCNIFLSNRKRETVQKAVREERSWKNMSDRKLFLKTVKPSLSNKKKCM